jgi:Na+-transporting methylmalonyl-CoA/oxaloacetate decarboxylase gamma subunit
MSFGVPAFAVVPLTASALVLSQQPDSGDNGGQGEDFGKSSPVGLLVLILFLIAVVFLVRSMSKHLKKVPETFDTSEQADEQSGEPAKDPEPAETAGDEAEKQPDATAAAKKSD